jgi:hypothetical protein
MFSALKAAATSAPNQGQGFNRQLDNHLFFTPFRVASGVRWHVARQNLPASISLRRQPLEDVETLVEEKSGCKIGGNEHGAD